MVLRPTPHSHLGSPMRKLLSYDYVQSARQFNRTAARESGGGEGSLSPERVAENMLNEILDKFGDVAYDIVDLNSALGGCQGPFKNVFIQECEAMELLLQEIKRSLNELNMGFAVNSR